MKNLEAEFILLLANPEFSKKDLNKFYQQLKKTDISKYFRKADKIKKLLSQDDSLKISNANPNNSNLDDYELTILNEIHELLRVEARMSVKNLVIGLSSYLEVEPLSIRQSFQNQILHFIRITDGSTVLNAAIKLRNSTIHNPEDSHWPLRDF